MAEKRRVYQIAERMRSLLGAQLQYLNDPRFSLVTITAVNLSNDLRSAKVYFTVTGGPARKDEVLEALKGAQGAFRREMGSALGLRFVPELRFYYDDTYDVIEQTSELIDRVRAADKTRSETGGSKES